MKNRFFAQHCATLRPMRERSKNQREGYSLLPDIVFAKNRVEYIELCYVPSPRFCFVDRVEVPFSARRGDWKEKQIPFGYATTAETINNAQEVPEKFKIFASETLITETYEYVGPWQVLDDSHDLRRGQYVIASRELKTVRRVLGVGCAWCEASVRGAFSDKAAHKNAVCFKSADGKLKVYVYPRYDIPKAKKEVLPQEVYIHGCELLRQYYSLMDGSQLRKNDRRALLFKFWEQRCGVQTGFSMWHNFEIVVNAIEKNQIKNVEAAIARWTIISGR
jgi:hypothetical protein